MASGSADGDLSLRMPARYHPASVKGAAWQVKSVLLSCVTHSAAAMRSGRTAERRPPFMPWSAHLLHRCWRRLVQTACQWAKSCDASSRAGCATCAPAATRMLQSAARSRAMSSSGRFRRRASHCTPSWRTTGASVCGWMTVASRGQSMCLLGRSVGHTVTLCSCHKPWSDRGEPAVTAEHTRTALQARQQTQHMLLQLLQSRRMHQRPQPPSSSPTAMRR